MKATSGDAYFEQDNGLFTIGTGVVEKQIRLDAGGKLQVVQLVNKKTGKKYLPGKTASDEFAITVDGKEFSGASTTWELGEVKSVVLAQGELEVIIPLLCKELEAERHYVAYPETGIIQEWTVFRNLQKNEVKINRPRIFIQRIFGNKTGRESFGYMTGAANFSGSTVYKTIPFSPGLARDFDSQGEPELMEVEGVKVNKWHPRFNGVGIWFEFFTVNDEENEEGWFLTFDYQGWWKAQASNRDNSATITGWCELLDYPLPAGGTLKMPLMMTGVYKGDMDDLGNTINDYIYRYKWDYTRDRYFNRTNLTIWREAPLTDRVFKMVETARYIGAERIWVDDFWFDAKGNWDGIFGDDWKKIVAYLARHDIRFRLWMPPWHADRLSKVALEHPEWMLDFHGNWYNWTIDMSREEAYQWVLDMLCGMQKKFGTYDLRVDGDPCNVKGQGSFDQTDLMGDWNGTFLQSQNFYRLYKEFKDKNPDAGLDGCSSGGHTLTIEAVRYTDQQQITDGECRHLGGYWTTLLMPIDKHQGLPIAGNESNWQSFSPKARQLFSAPLNMMQNPERGATPEVLEKTRQEFELFYWLRNQGVYGRWIKVYRPELEYGDKTYLMQRMTKDQRKGIVMISNNPLNPMLGKSTRIYPKGLLANETYLIEAMEGGMEPQTKSGKEWMEKGIPLSVVNHGENLLINLPGRPGQMKKGKAPQKPQDVKKQEGNWLGRSGMEVAWKPSGTPEEMVHYEVQKNGEFFTKISIGTFFFDDKGKKSDKYEIRSVNSAGQSSDFASAE